MKKAIFRTLGLAIVVAGGWYGYRFYKQMPERLDVIPTAKVQRGDVVIRAYSRGELRAARTMTLTAPNLFGTVQVTDLAPMGSAGAKAMAVVRGDADAYLHAGGQWEWDSAAPVGVVLAAGLHASRVDGSPLVYNSPHPYLPDLLICRPELAEQLLAAIAEHTAPPD